LSLSVVYDAVLFESKTVGEHLERYKKFKPS
jgi:hypothetical protein